MAGVTLRAGASVDLVGGYRDPRFLLCPSDEVAAMFLLYLHAAAPKLNEITERYTMPTAFEDQGPEDFGLTLGLQSLAQTIRFLQVRGRAAVDSSETSASEAPASQAL